jgi:hypothetical protein
MNLTFRSLELKREVLIDEVHQFELDDARRFHVELTMAIQAIDDSLMEAHRLQEEAGVPCDIDWMHKARKKRRITIAFASEVKRRLMKLEGVGGMDLIRQRRSRYDAQRDRFQVMRHDKLRELLKEELGPGVLEEIENEAHEAAEEEFKKWLAAHGYEQEYVP